jgi:phage-related protein
LGWLKFKGKKAHCSIADFLEGDIMVSLHGFIKKKQKTSKAEWKLATERFKLLKRQI